MNSKTVVINLTKNINKFAGLNVLILIILFFIVLLGNYDKKDFTIVGVCLLGMNLLVAWIMKRKIEKIVQHSFEKMKTRVFFDELTSVYNRTAGINRLEQEIARSKRHRLNLSIAMLDIDNFKSINDKYGHLTGDKVLIHIALEIKNSLRAVDVVARYGGEEFLMILPEADEIKAFIALNRVRENIEKNPVEIGDKKLYVTVSIGVTELDKDETLTEVIYKADMALYQAKRAGKNRIELAPKYFALPVKLS